MVLTREEVLRSLMVEPRDFVVEVGGGHRPFGRSDVIFDKDPSENSERAGALVHSAPVLIADAMKPPLPDRGCDLLFASHILEHIPDPDRFLSEVQRCSTRVYLEVPSLTRELMFAWSFHEWVVDIAGSHLTFYRNDIPQLFGDFFHRSYDFLFDAWNLQRHEDLNSWFYGKSADLTWEIAPTGAFEHAIAASPKSRAKVNFAPTDRVAYNWRQIGSITLQNLLPEPALDRLTGAVRRRRQGTIRPVTQPLVDHLACRQCDFGRLRLGDGEIRCLSCDTRYRQRQGLFDFDV
jgi:hypothetical protein